MDDEVEKYLRNELSELKANEFINLWKCECKTEAEKSIQIFTKHERWIESNLTNDLRNKNTKGNNTVKTNSIPNKKNEFGKLLKKPRWHRKKKINGSKGSNSNNPIRHLEIAN